MVQRNNQVPYHLQSILANQSARTSARLIIQGWIFQSEAQTPFQAHIRINTTPPPPPQPPCTPAVMSYLLS